MKIHELMGIYIEELAQYQVTVSERSDAGIGLSHVLWMINEIAFGEPMLPLQEQRWIGYIQALLNVYGVYSLDELREHSRKYLK